MLHDFGYEQKRERGVKGVSEVLEDKGAEVIGGKDSCYCDHKERQRTPPERDDSCFYKVCFHVIYARANNPTRTFYTTRFCRQSTNSAFLSSTSRTSSGYTSQGWKERNR